MFAILGRLTAIRASFLAFALGTLMALPQLACGGGGGGGATTAATPTPTPTPTPVLASPAITSFSAAKTPILAGAPTTLTAVFANGTGSVDKGVGAVISGTAITVTPASDTTYTLTVTNAAGTSVTASTSVAVTVTPLAPVITAPAFVTANEGHYNASVPAEAGLAYDWHLSNGTITGGVGTSGITFTAGAAGKVDFTCTATNASGVPSAAGTASSTVVGNPVAINLVAAANPVPFRGITTITPTFSGGTGRVDGGVGAVSNGTPFTSSVITAPQTLTLTVTNAAGSFATTSLVLSPQAVAVGALNPVAPIRTAGTTTTFSATANGGATNSLAWTASAGAMVASTGAWTAPPAPATVTITATSVDDVTKSATTTVTVVAAPITPVLTAPVFVGPNMAGYVASVPAQGAGSIYAWSIHNGSISAGNGTPTITFATGATGTVDLICVVSNAAGSPSSPGTTQSSISTAPLATSLVPVTNPVPFGGSTMITPTFSGGSGEVDQGVGVVTNAIPFSSGVITAARTFLLTVTNGASQTATTTVTVTPTPVSVSALSPGAATRTVNTGTTFSATATGGSTNGLTWTASAGSIGASTGVWTAPPTPQIVTITATSKDDPTKSATTLVNVVPAPTTPTISAPTYVDAGQGDFTAFVPAQASGLIYTWAISKGSLTAGQGTRSIVFTAGASGTLGLTCTMSNAAGDVALAATANCAIVPIPAISQIFASPSSVATGGASTLSYTFTGGTGRITPGNITVTSGGSNVVHPVTTTTYTLTVTSPSGTTTSDTVTVTVVAKPTITTFKAGPDSITAGQGTLLSFTFTDDGSIDQNVGTVTSGGQVAVFPTATTTYTLTATSAISGTTTQTVTVTVKSFTGKFVYVANTGGGVSGFKLDDDTGVLAELNNSPFDTGTETGGTTPIRALHVTSDAEGKFLFVVNGDGQTNPENTLTVFKIDASTGDLTKVAAYGTGTNPWASTVDPSGQFVYVRCAGSISAFSLNGSTGALTPLAAPTVATAAGTGEVIIHPSGQYLFTVGRDSDQLQVFNLNATTGALNPNGTYGLPAGTGPLSLALSHSGDYLFTKSEGAPGGEAQDCTVFAYYLDLQTGGLTAMADTFTGLQQADAFHGVSANPTQPVIYITLATSDNAYAAYALNLNTGALLPLSATTYDLFGGTGSDSLVVSRNGKWGFMTNYFGNRIAVGTVDANTGVLTNPSFKPVGDSPVSVCVVGSVQ